MVDSNAPLHHPAELAGTRALLLQGPMGPFFRRFATELRQRGVEVTKVNFNAGDDVFDKGPHVVHYRGSVDDWGDFFEELVRDGEIDSVFLFGDGRVYHRAAVTRAQQIGVPVFVFEEGYLRPYYITLEPGGVNGHSSMPRDPEFFRLPWRGEHPRSRLKSGTPGTSFWHAAWYSALYSMALHWLGRGYPHYRHHRPMAPLSEAFAWVRGGARKLWYGWRERGTMHHLTGRLSGQFFLVPLQVYCDYQLRHSKFGSMEEFIAFVIESMAENAPKDVHLVLKHHPLDRGYRDYSALIRSLSATHGLNDRVHYIHDLHLPTLLQHARGCVTLNSTVGLQAVHHRVPTKVIGTAVYDIPGLTSQQPLAAFFQTPSPVDVDLYTSYRRYLLHQNQGRGSFYRRLPGVPTPTGMLWPPGLGTTPTRPDKSSRAGRQG